METRKKELEKLLEITSFDKVANPLFNSDKPMRQHSLFYKAEQSNKLKKISRFNFLLKIRKEKNCHGFDMLKGKNDLPSVDEFVELHKELLQNKRHSKGSFTADAATLEIARKILQSDPSRVDGISYVLSKPTYSTSELSSIKVKLGCIDDYPEFKTIYSKSKNCEVMMCIGGPAAEDQAVIAAMIQEISQKLDKVIYVTRNHFESNVVHSAKQYHIRHANALNADPHLTGRHIMRAVLKRLIFGMKEQEIMDSSFLKIDVNSAITFKTLKIYLGNEINAIKQSMRHLVGKLSEHDINRISAFFGGEFFAIMEDKLGSKISGRKDNADLNHSTAIHVTFNEKEGQAAEVENKLLAKINIVSQELNREQIDNFFGEENQIHRAYCYPSDTHIFFDIHATNKNYAASKGVLWHDNVEITKILLAKDEDGEAKIAGVIDKEGNFTYVSKLHFTGGYKLDYIYDENSKSRFLTASMLRSMVNKIQDRMNLRKPLRHEMTTATGVSINAIFRKTKRFGEISVTNSHWTKIAENDEHMLVRITGGGNTGSEEYNPAYALNVIANTRRIFGDSLIGIVSTYGCSRAVNSKNSTQWAQLAKGLVVSYGKGGTGNTKRHFEALKALYKLGFAKEVVEFCNDYKSSRGGILGERIDEIMHASSKDFFMNHGSQTSKRMGFGDKISFGEIAEIIFSAVPFSLNRMWKIFSK